MVSLRLTVPCCGDASNSLQHMERKGYYPETANHIFISVQTRYCMEIAAME
jgi:hypothetical protein